VWTFVRRWTKVQRERNKSPFPARGGP